MDGYKSPNHNLILFCILFVLTVWQGLEKALIFSSVLVSMIVITSMLLNKNIRDTKIKILELKKCRRLLKHFSYYKQALMMVDKLRRSSQGPIDVSV
jgi:hypothetical protein